MMESRYQLKLVIHKHLPPYFCFGFPGKGGAGHDKGRQLYIVQVQDVNKETPVMNTGESASRGFL